MGTEREWRDIARTVVRMDEQTLGQNGNGLKTDKNGNRTEIKRERNGNDTVLPVPLYGRKMGTFFDAYRASFYYRKYITHYIK